MTGYPEPPTLPEWLHLLIVLSLVGVAVLVGWNLP